MDCDVFASGEARTIICQRHITRCSADCWFVFAEKEREEKDVDDITPHSGYDDDDHDTP